MTSTTPPLTALRAFAAFVRLGSIASAAESLNLTQGAIAHQIRALEGHVNVPLVERTGRQLGLTAQGRTYGYQVRNALEEIAVASENLHRNSKISHADAVLRISVLPSFAHGWLLRRLPGFRLAHPNIRLQLDGTMEYADLSSGRIDCAIRFGHGSWPDVVAQPLMQDTLLLVAAPALLLGSQLNTLADVVRLPMLYSTESWSTWVANMPEPDSIPLQPKAHLEFTESSHLVEAARLGLGVALTRRSVADNLLQRDELVKAYGHECMHPSMYYIVLPTVTRVSKPLAQFVAWLKAECDQFTAMQNNRVQSRQS